MFEECYKFSIMNFAARINGKEEESIIHDMVAKEAALQKEDNTDRVMDNSLYNSYYTQMDENKMLYYDFPSIWNKEHPGNYLSDNKGLLKLIAEYKYVNKLTIIISINGPEIKFPKVVTALIERLKWIHGETIFKSFLVLVMNNESISKV